eukprot:1638871-Prorocentrum_lima.AAC.1
MELLEDQHHLRLRQPTGHMNKKNIVIWLIWMRNNHSWPTLDNLMAWHKMSMKNKILNFAIDRKSS